MILYKYMSFSAAKLVIESNTVGFSCIEDLNDPFEGAALCFEDTNGDMSNVMHNAFKNRLSRNFGVLSLTRNPLNALMWSHYGDDHRGVVLGINMDIANLNDNESCVIPANYGEVIYTSTIPRNCFVDPDADELMSVGEEVKSFTEHRLDLFKNAFLYKDYVWGYEEEVRVVKNIKTRGISRFSENPLEFSNSCGSWKQIQIYGRPLYCLNLPKGAIVEAYLGCSSYSNVSRLGLSEEEYVNTRESWKQSGINTQLVRRCKASWNLEVSDHKI